MRYKLCIHKHERNDDLHESLRLEFTFLANLATVCRKLREALLPRVYESVAIFGKDAMASMTLMALMRLLQDKPSICEMIKHLHLDLHVDLLDLSGQTVDDLRYLNNWDKNTSIRIPEETLDELAYHQSEKFKEPCLFDHDNDIHLAFATCVLLYALPGLKELAISCDRRLLQHFHFPLDFSVSPMPCHGPNESLDQTSPLPKLVALTLRLGNQPIWVNGNEYLVGNEFLATRFLGRCADELCIQGYAEFYDQDKCRRLPDNLTTLILNKAWLDGGLIEEMLECTPTLKRGHYYDTFEHLVALDNLWINAWCVQEEEKDDDDESSTSGHSQGHSGPTNSNEVWKPNPVLASLPPSLKKLHLAGSAKEVEGLMKDLEWLALQDTNLKEIAFEMPSSGHYLYDLFENAGVKALRRADDEPVMLPVASWFDGSFGVVRLDMTCPGSKGAVTGSGML
ncbi:hypothetical protein CSOJ01_15861 [Colletotrichum sojae]|uniref:Uncharacterized protein n=1 Tax=Colletotrichum sojae TaxID=2175907 RepID=A0A8H6IM31_9PEZI|nr:hypothetical protein CSOJ01_15861 [Colletotrichum sojae]